MEQKKNDGILKWVLIIIAAFFGSSVVSVGKKYRFS